MSASLRISATSNAAMRPAVADIDALPLYFEALRSAVWELGFLTPRTTDRSMYSSYAKFSGLEPARLETGVIAEVLLNLIIKSSVFGLPQPN